MVRRLLVVVLSVTLLAVAAPAPAAAELRTIEITYSVTGRGAATTVESFAAGVAIVLADPRGWSLGGSIRFRRVPSGGAFRLWIVADALVPSFGGPCTRYYSCQPGRDIIINDDRWRGGSKYWPGSVARYRHLVINHELGHWLGFRHTTCPAPGAPAPVAQQQSKGLGGCTANPWPTAQERQRLAVVRGVRVLPLPGRVTVPTPSRMGSWTVAPDGGVFTAGDAGFFGSLGATPINQPVVGLAPTRAGDGYWLAASDGGVFTFGAARFHGSAGALELRSPVVAISATPTGRGYWLAGADGGVFTYGDAPFHGSAADSGAVFTGIFASGTGYVLVAVDGRLFPYGI